MQIYGLTETAPLLVANRARREDVAAGDDERRRRLVRAGAGAPALGVQLRIGADGEVLARGNHVLKSYWREPVATAAALAGGWLHTRGRRPPRRRAPRRDRPQEGHD